MFLYGKNTSGAKIHIKMGLTKIFIKNQTKKAEESAKKTASRRGRSISCLSSLKDRATRYVISSRSLRFQL